MNSELEEKQRMLREIQDKKGEIELFLRKWKKEYMILKQNI
jgi:hypothetical protein